MGLERQFTGPISTVEQRFGDLVANFVAANPHPHAVRLCKSWAGAWANLEQSDIFPNEPGSIEFEPQVRRAYHRQRYYARREKVSEWRRRRIQSKAQIQ